MAQGAKTFFPMIACFALSALFFIEKISLWGALGWGWLGAVQLGNAAAFSLSRFQFVHWAHAITFEGLAFLGIALMRLFPYKKTVQGKGQPILLIHGYMNHGSAWRIQKKRLEALGFGPVYAIDLGHPFRSIDAYGEKVAQMARQISREAKRNDLLLIGHSMGGLVASYYALRLAPPDTVSAVITIATPLFGTPLAHMAIGPNGRQMRPDSLFLQELRDSILNQRKIPFFHLATKTDHLVFPLSSAFFAQNEHFILEDVGHASLLYSQKVTDHLARWITKSQQRPL